MKKSRVIIKTVDEQGIQKINFDLDDINIIQKKDKKGIKIVINGYLKKVIKN